MCLLSFWGCRSESNTESVVETKAQVEQQVNLTEGELLESIKELRDRQQYDLAADAAFKALIQYPESVPAKLLSAEIEIERGNKSLAEEIMASIDIGDGSDAVTVDVLVHLLGRLERISKAADVLSTALKNGESKPRWRHELWRLLNRVGRRHEASMHAEILCREGLATVPELLSLVSRAQSFPTPDMKPKGEDLFLPGLGKARWFFSSGDRQRAKEELASQREIGFDEPAADALYGRILAELQDWEEFREWVPRVSAEARELNDYWAALGTYWTDNRQYEPAARGLLEAVYRDPTDRVSVQRLFSVLSALGRQDDAEQFRQRGIDIAGTERKASLLYANPTDIAVIKLMAQDMVNLGRPFETLAWSLLKLPDDSMSLHRQIAKQREDLQRNPRATDMANFIAILELDRTEFSMDSAIQEFDIESRRGDAAGPKRDEIAATPRLVNRAHEMGLQFQWYKDVENHFESIPIHESLGGGIAVLDFDLDGWPDVYLAQGSGDPPTDQATRSNQLFRNQVNRFHDVTFSASADDFNYSSGLAAGDINQDGFPDLFLGSMGRNRLLINNGDGTLRDVTYQLGSITDRFTSSVAIADINSDGLPDLFEANYIEMEGGFALPKTDANGKLVLPTPLSHFADSDRWFENLGTNQFVMHEITREVAKPGTSLGVVIADYDSDGKNEVFVGNDVRPNHFLVQSGKNQFINAADAKGVANGFDGASNGCMGIATGDFDRDGTLDLQIANYSLEAANLFLQTANGTFIDQSRRYGLAEPTYRNVGFGTKAVDVDRNGFLDFIVSNGHIFDVRDSGEAFQMAPQLLMSDGQQFKLVTVDDQSGYWDGKYLGRTITLLDYDRDGATDFLVGHLDQPLALLHNETSATGGWLQIELVGTASERDAIGARVDVAIGNKRYSEWNVAGDGYLSSDEAVLTFALDVPDPTLQIDVHWPSGLRQTFANLPRNHRFLIVEANDNALQR
jgi:tetratricopeptide (TPR) repeat protein